MCAIDVCQYVIHNVMYCKHSVLVEEGSKSVGAVRDILSISCNLIFLCLEYCNQIHMGDVVMH